MRQIKLVGRELAVIRAIEPMGSSGRQLFERTNIDPPDLLDILNGLAESGYVEAYLGQSEHATMEAVKLVQLHTTRFEINPSYYLELKKVMQRH